MAGEEGSKKIKLNSEVSLKNIRVFYMEGLKTLFARSLSNDCYDALKKVGCYKDLIKNNTKLNIIYIIIIFII